MRDVNRNPSIRRAALTLPVVALALALAIILPWHLAAKTTEPAHQKIQLSPRQADPVSAPAFSDVIEAVQPAVVNISATRTEAPTRDRALPRGMPSPHVSPFDELFRRFGQQPFGPPGSRRGVPRAPQPELRSMGSGFVIDPGGLVVTNHHVIDGADEITVILDDGSRHPAKLAGSDAKTDLALLAIEVDHPLAYVELGDSDAVRVGDWVVAIGNPFGLGGTATAGIVSARGRDIQAGPFDDFLQIDAPINSGNSGGPLFDLSGRVIGINTAIYSPNGGNVGIGFAIPATQATPVLDQLRAQGHVVRGFLGVSIQGIDEEMAEGLGIDSSDGALVASVVPGSPAAKAELEPGDVIRRLGETPIAEIKDLTRAVAAVEPGHSVELSLWREDDTRTVDVTIGESPDPIASANTDTARPSKNARLGLELGDLTDATRARLELDDDVEGALVTNVDAMGPAARKGLVPGDVVTAVGRRPVTGAGEAAEAIGAAIDAGRSSIVLQVARGDGRRYVAIRVS